MPLNSQAQLMLNNPREFVESLWWYTENPDSHWILRVRSVEFNVAGQAETLIFEDFVPGGRGTQVYRFSLAILRQNISSLWFLMGGGGWFEVFVRQGQRIQEHDSGRLATVGRFDDPRNTRVSISGSHRDGTNSRGQATYSGFQRAISLYQLLQSWSPVEETLTSVEILLEGRGPDCPNCLLPMYYRSPTRRSHQMETCACTPRQISVHRTEAAAQEVNALSQLWESAPATEELPPAPPPPPATSRFDRVTEE